MKNPKGFRGKYFSLAAILALNATLVVAQETQSFADTQANITPKEYAQSEEETPPLNEIPVVVVSKKIKVAEVGAPFATEVYTKKEIQKSHSKDIYEFLNTQTSVSTMPNFGNPFTQAIDMRGYGLGYGFQNTVVTVNGRRLNSIDQLPQLLSAIPLDSIEKIEILKGTGSVEYGDGANAGAINIMTKDTDGAFVKSYVGDNGLWFGSLGVGVKEEKFSINGYIDDYSHNGFKYVANDGTKDESWNRNKSIKATLTPVDDLTFNLGKTFSKMNILYANYLTLAEYNQNPYILPSTGYNEQYFSSDVLNYGLKYQLTNRLSFDAQFFNEDKVSKYASGWGSNYDTKSYDAKINYTQGDIKALIGIQASDTERVDTFNQYFTKENLGVYTKADYVLGKNTFSLGARNESIKYTYRDAFSNLNDSSSLNAYDLGYNYKITARTSFFTNFNRSFQAPDVDRFFDWNTYAFNGFIEPMKVDTINIGFNDFSVKNKLKVTLFYSWIENEIYYNNDYHTTSMWSGTNTNLKETKKRGFELYDRYNFLSNLFATLNYTYVDTKIIDDGLSGAFNGRVVPGVSPHNVKVTLGYSPIKPLTLLLSDTYKSRTYAIDDFAGSYGKMESYHVTDISATYTYKNYEFFAKINNIFDEANAMFANGWSGLGVYPVNYERTFMIGASARF